MRSSGLKHRSIACLVMVLGALCLLYVAPVVAGNVDPRNPVTRPGDAVASSDEWRPPAHVDGELIVKLSTFDADAVDNINMQFGTVTKRYFPQLRIYLLGTGGEADEFQLAEQIASRPNVELAHPNYIVDPLQPVQGSFPIADEYLYGDYLGQPAAEALSLDEAHQYATGAYIKVAVIDGGVDFNHPALEGKAVSGYDYVDNDDYAFDEPGGENSGHGTFVAGIIHLAAPDAEIRAYRVSGPDGSSDGYLVAEAIMQAIVDGCQIVNLSLVTTARHEAIASAIEYAENFNTLVVAAAGNGQHKTPLYPASDSYVIAVGAVDADAIPAAFSNSASYVDVWAPGESIYSPYLNEGYAWWSGTSFAAPFVAGQAALLIEKNRDLNRNPGEYVAREWLINTIIGTARDIGPGDVPDGATVYGLIDMLASLLIDPPVFGALIGHYPYPDIIYLQSGTSSAISVMYLLFTTETEAYEYSIESVDEPEFLTSWYMDSPSTPTFVQFMIDPSGLSPGIYQDTVQVTIEGIYNSPITRIFTISVTNEANPVEPFGSLVPPLGIAEGNTETIYGEFLVIARRFDPSTGQYDGSIELPYQVSLEPTPEIITQIRLYTDWDGWNVEERTDGLTPDIWQYAIDAGSLAPGHYVDTIFVHVEGAVNNPYVLEAHLDIFADVEFGLTVVEPAPDDIHFHRIKDNWPLGIDEEVDFFGIEEHSTRVDTLLLKLDIEGEPREFYMEKMYDTPGLINVSPQYGSTTDTIQFVIDWSKHDHSPSARYYTAGKWFVQVDNISNYNYTFAIRYEVIEDLNPCSASGPLLDDVGNSPNPFNSLTTVFYSMPEAGDVRLDVYNIVGQLVRTLADGRQEAGRHSVIWDGRDASGEDVASGVYFYRIRTEGFSQTKKMVLLK